LRTTNETFGTAFEPDCCLALPTASIAVMGPKPAVNAVYYNKIQAVPEGAERDAFVAKLQDEYRQDVDIFKLASELVIDSIIEPERLRAEIAARLKRYARKNEPRPARKHLVPPM
jgi:methylmalonyl-CoA decarboxylase subunit alpha